MSELKIRRIAYIPYEDPKNAYIFRMQTLLSNFGKIEKAEGIKKAILRLLKGDFASYDIIWLNFTDNEMLKPTGRIGLLNVIKLFSKTAIMVLLARKAIFLRHNNYPHATHPKSIALAKLLVNAYERMFDIVVTHSGAELKDNKHYCPHPLHTIVRDSQVSAQTQFNLPQEYFIVFGRIVPYKKIEQLIQYFPPNKTLVIAGSVGDKEYAQKLSEIKKENIIFKPGYLSDEQAQILVSGAKAVVISHADADMVVSGTFFYAMTLEKPVFAVQTDFLNWIKPRISPGLLLLADDVTSLCKVIGDADSNLNTVSNAESIQVEFGDRAVIAALSNILN